MPRRSASVPLSAGIVCLVVTATGASAPRQNPQPPSGLTLTGAIERAVAANPTIAAARLQLPIDQAGAGVAAERLNPELAYEWSRETPRQSIGATVPLELGGKRQRRIDLANATIAVSQAELARLIAEVQNDVRRAYFDVVAADVRVRLAEDVRALSQRARDAANARVTSGDVPRSDLTQADLALAISAAEVVAARGEAAATRAELNALLAQPVDTPLVLANALTDGALPPLDAALALATASNGELKVLDQRIAEQSARLNLARSLTRPDMSAGGAFTYDAEPEFAAGWRVSFAFTVPILSSHKAGVFVEDATLTRLKADRAVVVARMSGGIAAALSRAAAARDQLTGYETTMLPLALEAERQAQAAYDGGQIGLPALVQALQTARETRQRGLQAGLDYQHALADLERAVGTSIR
jgi:outer membrane protein, heavy metal efflux system